MPKLNNWYIKFGVADNWRSSPNDYTAPELLTKHLSGVITEDEKGRFLDGEHVTTSTIKGQRNGKVITNSGTEYDLLEPEPMYLKEFPEARERLFNSLPQIPDPEAWRDM